MIRILICDDVQDEMDAPKRVPISKKYAGKIQYAQWLFGEGSK